MDTENSDTSLKLSNSRCEDDSFSSINFPSDAILPSERKEIAKRATKSTTIIEKLKIIFCNIVIIYLQN
jgi:hypothetical protein